MSAGIVTSVTEGGDFTQNILQILTAHQQSARNQRCTCGWQPNWAGVDLSRNPFPQYQQHRLHLAELIAAAPTPTQVTVTPCDPETYARGHNAGYETAMAQGIAEDPTIAADWLEERLREAKEQAWDECEAAKYEIRIDSTGKFWEPYKANPYRKEP